jgi:hypothetical protein
LDGLSFLSIDADESTWLKREFEEQEVWELVRGLNGDKASGPDGFTMAFFPKCWKILKKDLMVVFAEFHSSGHFEKSLNATFVSLISKKTHVVDVKDFALLVWWVGCIRSYLRFSGIGLSQCWARLSPNQNAFIGGQQISDSVLIANEFLDCQTRSMEFGMLCKLDLEKAFDHVNWEFLLYLLQCCGFGEKWTAWIEYCISTVRFSILVNGIPSGFLSSSRGLLQGDPLSPLLFVVVMEALSRMLIATMDQRLLTGFSVGFRDNNILVVNQLLFADDTDFLWYAVRRNSTSAMYLLMI